MSRPKINGISVNIKNFNGTTETIDVKPDSWAVFFQEKSVKEMLGAFYKKNPGKKLARADSEKAFGKEITKTVFLTASHIELTDKTIEKIWKAKKKTGDSVSHLSKTPPCIIE
jgi:hypothetical protein